MLATVGARAACALGARQLCRGWGVPSPLTRTAPASGLMRSLSTSPFPPRLVHTLCKGAQPGTLLVPSLHAPSVVSLVASAGKHQKVLAAWRIKWRGLEQAAEAAWLVSRGGQRQGSATGKAMLGLLLSRSSWAAMAAALANLQPTTARAEAALAVQAPQAGEAYGSELLDEVVNLVTLVLDTIHAGWRLIKLGAIFTFCLGLLPGCFMGAVVFGKEDVLDLWYPVLVKGLQTAGPTFIKLGQWASTRPDFFPPYFCAHLAVLHSSVTPEPFAKTRRTMEAYLGGRDIHEVFSLFESVPVGAGCVAQVHRAVLRSEANGAAGSPQVLAVKIKRAQVDNLVALDLRLMRAFAAIVTSLPVPGVQYLAMSEAVDSFASHMLAQLDLCHEARNLERLRANFQGSSLVFPRVSSDLPPSKNVLVETFEDGEPLLTWANSTSTSAQAKKALALPMVEAFFQMVLQHNLVHGDLHPGNILVRTTGGANAEVKDQEDLKVEIVLVDAGLCVELNAVDQRNFIDLFSAVAHGNGEEAAKLMIERSKLPEHHLRPEVFEAKMSRLVGSVMTTGFKCSEVKIGEVLHEVMNMARVHHVMVDSQFATLVISITILEGIGRQLFPDLDLFAVALPILARARSEYKAAAADIAVQGAGNYFGEVFDALFGKDTSSSLVAAKCVWRWHKLA